MKKSVSFDYQFFASSEELSPSYQNLLLAAQEATTLSFAPYSKFHVGAALLLENGQIVKGSNQENASFPAGICAERVALSTASSVAPHEIIVAVAVAYQSESESQDAEMILSPCGICRQSLLEAMHRQNSHIKLVLSSPSGSVIMVDSVAHLLPLAFSASNL